MSRKIYGNCVGLGGQLKMWTSYPWCTYGHTHWMMTTKEYNSLSYSKRYFVKLCFHQCLESSSLRAKNRYNVPVLRVVFCFYCVLIVLLSITNLSLPYHYSTATKCCFTCPLLERRMKLNGRTPLRQSSSKLGENYSQNFIHLFNGSSTMQFKHGFSNFYCGKFLICGLGMLH